MAEALEKETLERSTAPLTKVTAVEIMAGTLGTLFLALVLYIYFTFSW